MSETNITPLVTAIDRLTQAINLLAQRDHCARQDGFLHERSIEAGDHVIVCPLDLRLETFREVHNLVEFFKRVGIHHDSSTPAGPESPSEPTVEGPGHPGDDSHPDARNGGDLS